MTPRAPLRCGRQGLRARVAGEILRSAQSPTFETVLNPPGRDLHKSRPRSIGGAMSSIVVGLMIYGRHHFAPKICFTRWAGFPEQYEAVNLTC